jgi:Raf kinase inhibitor-like YbhB/YbcL family protein
MRTTLYVLFLAAAVSLFASLPAAEALVLTSSEFSNGERLPANAGYEKGNISPCLEWDDGSQNIASFALVMDDPDARGWVHWVVYNIPPSARSLKSGCPAEAELADGTLQGVNSFGKTGYGGPCPPSGVHRYVFTLYALDAKLDIGDRADRQTLMKAMKGHVLEKASLTGKYGK